MSSIIRATTTSGLQVAPDNSGSLQLQTNGTTTAVTIDTSQNVGIGTTSPTLKFQVNGQVGINTGTTPGANGSGIAIYASDFPRLSFRNSTTGDANTDGLQIYMVDNDVSYNLLETGYQRWFTGNAERMRIDSSGNVLINQTANTYSGKLAMSHDSSVDDGLVIRDTRTSGSSNQVSFIYNTTQVGRILTTSSATSYVTSSDYRLKENIAPMTGALEKVAQLKPVTYKWKVDGTDGQGFIAHELQAIVPDCVSGEKDAVDADGNIKPQGIDTSFLVATLTAAIQEQQTIINDLKARIETLEAK